MRSVLTCVRDAHDHRLIAIAALVCTVGVYASVSISLHASRSQGGERRKWALVSIVAAGSTAWATHFLALLAFRPGVAAAFDPFLTIASLLAAILIIGTGLYFALGQRAPIQRFAAGVIVGSGVCALHYLGQAAYAVQGDIFWDRPLAFGSAVIAILLSGIAVTIGGLRRRWLRPLEAPLLLASIAILHFGGMTAFTVVFDPRVRLPDDAIAPETIAPAVACVCFGLLALAIFGFKFSLDASARLRRDKIKLAELADLALEGLLICDGDKVLQANKSFEKLSGFGGAQLASSALSKLFPRLDVVRLPLVEERETELFGVDGQVLPVRVLRSEVSLGAKVQTVIAVRDQRERLQTEAIIRELAYTDTLTGLANRARFIDLVDLSVASARGPIAVLIIDLDRFKPINDTLGHAAGDQVLQQVGARLKSLVRNNDVVARLGGDEFVILQASSQAGASAALASRCVEALSEPYLMDGHTMHLGASVGVARFPEDGQTAMDLLRNADLALYKAKTDGKGAVRMFEPALDERMQMRRKLELGLRDALVNGEFEVHYQPLLDTRSQRITAAEALVRWRHSTRGLIPPGDFIPLAEETGLIVPLGAWVLRTACHEAAGWPAEVSVAVNLSPAQFRDAQLADTVRSALSGSGLDAGRLELEITEGVLIADEAKTLSTLEELRASGVRISMDDFGTGYSSLSYLRRFPFDKIKIDRSFVSQLPEDPESIAIVRAIITMGACLGLTTTVEGVETLEQLAFTTAEGCDHVQGFFVSRPLPSNEFAAFLQMRDLQTSELQFALAG